MSLILRHRPDVINIYMDEHGYVFVDDLICKISEHKNIEFTLADLNRIVATDEKQRYSFNSNRTKIRANQGHSISVDVELKESNPPPILYHGTSINNITNIMNLGLVKMDRLYVHMTEDEQAAKETGARYGKPVVLKINAAEMCKHGYKFFVSENNVWLTDHVPFKYIEIKESNND